jgi:micrococcal nuclease
MKIRQFNQNRVTILWRLVILGCLLLLGGCQSSASPQGTIVQVQRVVSGNTLEVLIPNQQPALLERVRLIGLDAPDIQQQPWGEAAKNYLDQLIRDTEEQGRVLLELGVQEKDDFDRLLAYVWQEDNLLNEQLVKQGHALAVPRLPNDKYDLRLARAQDYARIMGSGIWNPDRPMRSTPTEFRRQNS